MGKKPIIDTLSRTEIAKDADEGLVQALNRPWRWAIKKFKLTDKNRKFTAMLILIIIFLGSLVGYKQFKVYGLGKELTSMRGDLKLANLRIEEKESAAENLRSENKELRDQIRIFGYGDENEITGLSQNIEDFLRDWDYSDSFYVRNNNELCPKSKGQNFYQRMSFTRETPLAGSKAEIKFKMIDEYVDSTYSQRFVVGVRDNDGVVSEFDFPTKDKQTVNFRERDLVGFFGSIQDGKSLSSPIKEGGVINLTFETSQINTNQIAEKITLNYLSSIKEYGPEDKSIGYYIPVNDSQPESLPINIFIGSYVGGCIQILDWKVN
jgi:cell division protein FtsL